MKMRINKKQRSLSVVIPVYNPNVIISKSYQKLQTKIDELAKNNRIGNWEAIFIDNGSTDNTLEKLIQLKNTQPGVTVLHTDTRGIGLALKAGLSKAKGDLIYFTAIDHPFKLIDLDNLLDLINKQDLIYASKNHFQSIYKAPIKRKIASQILSGIVKVLFNLPITDTQGTFIITNEALAKILPFCNSSGPFFQAQLAINAKRRNLRIGEVPVDFQVGNVSSSFSLFRDGTTYVYEAIREKFS